MLTRRSLLGAAAAAVLLLGGALHAKATQIILIGGGTADSPHTVAVRQVCALVDEHAGYKYGCIPRAAPGSVFNIRAIEIGLMEFGIAQSGRTHEAVTGAGAWEGKPVAGLRSVFRLQPETVLLVTGADVADDLVYDLVRLVFENLDVLKGAHPSFAVLDPAAMLQNLTASLHPGAARYYREQGWL